ncbi:MAG: M48 family metalloprotease [Microcystaceae cyanobacterium]
MSLQAGLKALQEQHYSDAIALLSSYCQEEVDQRSPYYIQAQIALARAYRGHNEHDQAIAICETLKKHPQKEVKSWASGFISIIKSQENSGFFHINAENSIFKPEKAGRVYQKGVRLLKPKMADSLSVAAIVTSGLIWLIISGIVLLLGSFGLVWQGLEIALGIGLILLLMGLIISPILMDQLLNRLYSVRWENLTAIRQHSEESAEVILQICRERGLKFPLLGIIDYPIPLAFSYGSFWGKSRILVSQGLFTYLDEEEIATVYGHELGLVLPWDKAIMTLICLPTPLLHWISAYLMKPKAIPQPIQWILTTIGSFVANVAQLLTYPLIYLSRTRTYHADHLASEITGNPNGLIRALAKAAYGMVKEQSRRGFPNRLEMGISPINFYNPQNAIITGTTYRQHSSSQRMGQVFLWDLYNPWSWWLEFISTHPLTGRRVRVLTHYAEQMELDTEFSMASVAKEGNKLNKGKLRLNFALDWLAIALPLIGILGGITTYHGYENVTVFKAIFWGFGIGTWLQTLLVYPFPSKKLLSSDIFSLMADPYASPVRGRSVTLSGKLLGNSEQKTVINTDLQLQDPTGVVKTKYATRWGELTELKSLESFVNVPIRAIGWFYRGIMPSFDLSQLDNAQGHHLYGYHRFRAWLFGSVAIFLGLFL